MLDYSIGGSKKMRSRSLSIKFLSRIFLLVIVICFSLTTIAISQFSKIQNKQISNSLSKSMDDSCQLIELTIKAYTQQVEAIAHRDDIRSMDWNLQKDALIAEAKRIGFEGFQIGDTAGNVRNTNGKQYYDGDKNYYKRTLGGHPNLSDVFYDSELKKMVVLVSAPIYDFQNNIVGILSATEDASFTNKIISSVKLDYSGFSFVINNYGDKMAGVDYNGKTKLENDIRSKDFAPNTPNGQFALLQTIMIQGEPGVETFYRSGEEFYLAYNSINDGYWHIGIVQNKGEALLPLTRLLQFMILVTIAAIIIGLITAILLARHLRPLTKVNRKINEIASGKADLTQRIESTGVENNEIGQVVSGFNTFTEKLQTIMSVMKDSKDSLVSVGTDLRNDTDTTLKSIDLIIENIKQIGQNITSQGECVSETASAVNEISANIISLKNMIKNQSDNVANASSAVEEMIGNINSVNNSMIKMADSFKTLEEKAVAGVRKQDDVNQKINQVGEQSTMLNEANKVILAIAEQTNLLAMNAAIEAAHAGESGKGFSVVADEIRKLSETSSEQSATIGQQLQNIQSSIDEIITASEESRLAFKAVSSEIVETDKIVHEVKIAMEEQAIGSKQINESLFSMNSSTAEVSQAVIEMSQGAEAILQEVQILQTSTSNVKVKMDEMEDNAKIIGSNAESLSSISNQMSSSINDIGSQVDQFEV